MKKFILLIAALMFTQTLFASQLRTISWDKVVDKKDLAIFVPTNYKHPSGLIPIRFRARLDHAPLKVLTVLADNGRKTEWLPNSKEIKVLEKQAVGNITVYYRYNAPWPFNDRDFIVQNLGKFDPKTKTISVDIRSISHAKDPKPGDTVRGKTYDGYSIIKPDGKGTMIEMAFLNDFGGNIPNFIINIVQKKWPTKFVKQIKSQLEKPDIKINPEFKVPFPRQGKKLSRS